MAPTYKQRYYTPLEVEGHSSSKDLWVSFLGKVYDLTPLASKHAGNILLKPILNAGGKDISHWFDTNGTNNVSFDPKIRTHIDSKTGCEVPYTPQGRFIHIPPAYPSATWANDFGTPWWKDDSFCVGHLSSKTRQIRIINTLTSQEHTLEVCGEETLEEILNRFLKYNKHSSSYTWKYNGVNLDMTKTLEQNGVKDEDEEFYELNFNEEEWLPAIHIYFNDDLTEA